MTRLNENFPSLINFIKLIIDNHIENQEHYLHQNTIEDNKKLFGIKKITKNIYLNMKPLYNLNKNISNVNFC